MSHHTIDNGASIESILDFGSTSEPAAPVVKDEPRLSKKVVGALLTAAFGGAAIAIVATSHGVVSFGKAEMIEHALKHEDVTIKCWRPNGRLGFTITPQSSHAQWQRPSTLRIVRNPRNSCQISL